MDFLFQLSFFLPPLVGTVYVATLLKPGALRAVVMLITYSAILYGMAFIYETFFMHTAGLALVGMVLFSPVVLTLAFIAIHFLDKKHLKNVSNTDIN